jgi:glycosyltransferase involved in cell wall biosynthesis
MAIVLPEIRGHLGNVGSNATQRPERNGADLVPATISMGRTLKVSRLTPTIHLINPLASPNGGSEWRTISLYEALLQTGECSVELWAQQRASNEFTSRYPIRKIAGGGQFPRDGVVCFIGVYFDIGNWITRGSFSRVIVTYNTPSPRRLLSALSYLSDNGRNRVEIVYPSKMVREATGLPGTVEYSPIDVTRFAPEAAPPAKVTGPRFVVGRLSRDAIDKFHHQDAALFRALAATGCEIRVMGGICLREQVGMTDGIVLTPAGSRDAVEFLRDLDCFIYRTGDGWSEPYGRVVAEAMACGLPVVCHRRGGYLDIIEDGVNGFLFDSNDDAEKIVARLQREPALRERIGQAARKSMLTLYSSDNIRRTVDFYLHDPARHPPMTSAALNPT